MQERAGANIETPRVPPEPDRDGWREFGCDSESDGDPLVPPRVAEAFGGLNRAHHLIGLVHTEFIHAFEERGVETLAIAAIHNANNYSIRFFPGEHDSILVPIQEIASALVNDTAYENGWILAHSHTGSEAKMSDDDERTTCVLSWLGNLLQKPLVDHWIFSLSHGQFLSVADDFPGTLTPRIRFGIEE